MEHVATRFSIRPASRAEALEIRRLIHFVRINPMSLDWRRFLVCVDAGGRVLGCGQVKPHGDGTRELASLAVWPEYRRKGIASALIGRLIEGYAAPLYLTCRASLGPFYERFGFRVVAAAELPPYFRRIKWIFALLRRFVAGEDLLVMRREEVY